MNNHHNMVPFYHYKLLLWCDCFHVHPGGAVMNSFFFFVVLPPALYRHQPYFTSSTSKKGSTSYWRKTIQARKTISPTPHIIKITKHAGLQHSVPTYIFVFEDEYNNLAKNVCKQNKKFSWELPANIQTCF